MKNIKKITSLFIMIGALSLSLSCNTEDSVEEISGNTEENNIDTTTTVLTASIQGVVTTDSGLSQSDSSSSLMGSLSKISTPSGVTVEVFEIDDTGTETSNGATVTTNSDGSFTIEITAGNSGNYIVVAKDTDGNEASTIVDGSISEGETVTVEPITETSSSQVDVFRDLKKSGEAAGCFIHPLTLKDHMSPGLANHLSMLTDPARSQLIGIFSHGLCKLRFSKVKALESLGISLPEIQEMTQNLSEIRKQLNLDLYNAQFNADVQTAIDQAYSDHAISSMQLFLAPSTITLSHHSKGITMASKIHSIFDERYIGKLFAEGTLHPDLNDLAGYRFAIQKETAVLRTLNIHRYISHLYRSLTLTLANLQSAYSYLPPPPPAPPEEPGFIQKIHGPDLTLEAILAQSGTTIDRVNYVKSKIEQFLNDYRNAIVTDLQGQLTGDTLTKFNAAKTSLDTHSDSLKSGIFQLIQEDAANLAPGGDINLIHTPQDYTQKYLDFYAAAASDLAVTELKNLEPKLAELLVVLSANRF